MLTNINLQLVDVRMPVLHSVELVVPVPDTDTLR